MQLRKAAPTMALAFLAIGARPVADAATSRSRVEINTLQIMDLTEMGQGEMESSSDLEGILSVTIDEGTHAATVVLDSLDGSAEGQGQQITPAMISGAIGASWSGTLDEKGRLSEIETELSSPLATRLERLLRGLFPYIKSGVSAEETWIDTLTVSDSTDHRVRVVTAILTYTAKGDTTYNGMKALIVESTSNVTIKGHQQAQGLDFEGTSTGSGMHFVGEGGRYLGGTRTSATELEVSGPALPGIIPLTEDTEFKIELLP